MVGFCLTIITVIGVLNFIMYYNSWLQRTHGCSAFTFWRVIGGVVDLFLLLGMLAADTMMHGVILFLIVAVIFLLLFFANYRDSKSVLHGFLMTLWLLLIGGVILYFFCALTNRSKKV